jgi:hypothetical protein
MRKRPRLIGVHEKLVWPDKCYCTGVNVAPVVEMLNVSPVVTGPASLVQGSDLSPQTFKASLLALSRAPSETGVVHEPGTDIGRPQKAITEGEKLAPTAAQTRAVVISAPNQQVVQQQTLAVQQPSLINPALSVLQLPPEQPKVSPQATTSAAGQAKSKVAVIGLRPIERNISRPRVAMPDSVPSSPAQKESDAPQVPLTLPSAAKVSQTATQLSNAVANVTPDTLFTEVPAFHAFANVAASLVAHVVPGVLPDIPSAFLGVVSSTLATSVPDAISSAVPTAVPHTFPDALQNSALALVPNAIPSSSPHATPTPALPRSVEASATDVVAPKSSPAATSQANPPLAASDASRLATGLIAPKTSPTSTSLANPPAPASDSSRLATGLIVPKSSPTSTSQANPPAPVSDSSRLATDLIAPKSSPVSTSQSTPSAPSSDPSGSATGLIAPGTTSDPLVALIQPAGGLPVAAEGVAPSVAPVAVANPPDMAVVNQKDGATAINEAAGPKQHAPSASDQTGSQTGSQETAPSRDQSQGGASQQGQSAAPLQMSFANHTTAVVDHAQNAGATAPLQIAATPAGVSGHTLKTTDIATPTTIPLPQAVPVINTAKLIQSAGQSEMRVDMRSNDFGNISISTSATRDLISAQISLDHGELARTLAAHLPEMQARLGNQPMDVRIDMNGQATGQRAGTSAGMSNGSADGSRGDRRQEGSAASSPSANGFAGYGNSSVATLSMPGDGRQDDRLDIRA